MAQSTRGDVHSYEVSIRVPDAVLSGTLHLAEASAGLVIFAHGSGSSRHSPRNRYVAEVLHKAGLGTLLFDLLTADEEDVDRITAELRFNIGFLSERLIQATHWVGQQPDSRGRSIGYFGASTGAAAALVAAARQPSIIHAVVSRGGRPDMAGSALAEVQAPTLLIVGGNDVPVIGMNREALDQLRCEKRIEIVPGATHLFEEPGTLEQVAEMARDWFLDHLRHQASGPS